jgi:MscS family membrane protein
MNVEKLLPAMRITFKTCFRAIMAFLAIAFAWSLWAGTQTTTNLTSVAATNQSSVVVREVELLDGHYLTFGLDRIQPLKASVVLGEPLWKYIASFIYILLAFYAAKLIDCVARVWLKQLAARTQTKLDDLLIELLHGPVKVVAFVVLLNIGLNILDWSERTKLYLSKGLILIVAGSLTWLAVKLIELLLDLWKRRSTQDADRRFDDQLFSVLRISLYTFVIVVAVLVTAQNLGINITAVITSLSIGGLAVGLAAQDTLANLFGAVAVFIDKPFRVGDEIKLDGAEGKVESVGLRSTRVRNPNGHLVTVPNKIMGTASITNLTNCANTKTTMNLVLAHSTPTAEVERALSLLAEIYRGHPMTLEVFISFNRFAGRHINIMIVHWWKGTDYRQYLAGIQQMNLAVKTRFDAEGISLA